MTAFSSGSSEESDEEIAKIIESELPSPCDGPERFERLLKHTAELANRWIGFVVIKGVPCRTLVENDAFRALRISLNLATGSIPEGTRWQDERMQFHRLRLAADALMAGTERTSIDSFVAELKGVLNI